MSSSTITNTIANMNTTAESFLTDSATLKSEAFLTESSAKTFADTNNIKESASYVLNNIIFKDVLSSERCDIVMKETLSHWAEHINPAFLQYRKSVAEGNLFAAIEWRDGNTPGGSTVIDARGNEYIDCLGGYGIYNVGHSNPTVLAAVRKQMEKQSLHSQELLDPLRAYCAAVLARTLPGDGALKYAFFTNSGAESVEHCLKFAMLSTNGRRHYVGILGAFHGKTMGALSATSKSVFRKAFSGGLLNFSHVPVNDLDALRRVFEASKFTGNEIAGFIVEPVLGEGGIHVCTDEYLQLARKLCNEYGARLIFDEVQSGMGRTGKWWACQHANVVPDLVAIGKAFGGGITAAGAVVGTKEVWGKYFENPFLFTTTFGGNPVAMAAAIATIHEIEDKNLVVAAEEKGNYIKSKLQELQHTYPHILKEVRGRGLMIGLEFPSDDIGYTFSRGVFSRKVLLAGTLINSRVIRVEPPLTITQTEIDAVLDRFRDTLVEMHGLGIGIHRFVESEVPLGKSSSSMATSSYTGNNSMSNSNTNADVLVKTTSANTKASADDTRDRNDSVVSSEAEPTHGTRSVGSGEDEEDPDTLLTDSD